MAPSSGVQRSGWPTWLTVVLVLFLLLVGCTGFGGCMLVGGYNRAVRLSEAVDQSWSEVENQLQRRNDLIPNLVNTVKGITKHEETVFSRVMEARTKYFQAGSRAEKISAANGISSALSRLLMLREAYPNLKANENFLKLQDTLEGTENRIAVARKRYNEAVQRANTYRREFFGRFFANWVGLEEAEYFKAAEEAKAVPEVDFGTTTPTTTKGSR